LSGAAPVRVVRQRSKHDFEDELRRRGIVLPPLAVETLQVNITKMCNQVCRHCHVDASPARTEAMSPAVLERCLEILAANPRIAKLDITGGAPELHPGFDALVERARALGKHVIARHNLTVQLDGHPVTRESKEYLPAFFAQHRVEVISSLPYYQAFFTDAQRGAGVFGKSIEAMRRLNAVGYGRDESGLVLNLVYNPVGPYLPAPQASLEADYKKSLKENFGLVFNSLYTITNMPINRFKLHLEKSGQYEAYMDKLLAAFNPVAAEGVMCRSLVSVGHDGRIHDCDFNQMLAMDAVDRRGRPLTIFDFDFERALGRDIRFDSHCLGCTAGAGSSCGGTTA
jgi:radical SAM/Cys-rich protein